MPIWKLPLTHKILFFLLSDDLFTIGLASFLTGHILNVIAFLTPTNTTKIFKMEVMPKLGIPFLLILLIMLTTLYTVGPGASGEKLTSSSVLCIAVPVYALVLGVAPWRATVRRYLANGNGESKSIWTLVVVGYIIYMGSDATLAIDRFSWGVPNVALRNVIVMSTYWIGQLFISSAVDVCTTSCSIFWLNSEPIFELSDSLLTAEVQTRQ